MSWILPEQKPAFTGPVTVVIDGHRAGPAPKRKRKVYPKTPEARRRYYYKHIERIRAMNRERYWRKREQYKAAHAARQRIKRAAEREQRKGQAA